MIVTIEEEKLRQVMGALDAAFNGALDMERLKEFAIEFIEHLEDVHKWKIVPPEEPRGTLKEWLDNNSTRRNDLKDEAKMRIVKGEQSETL